MFRRHFVAISNLARNLGGSFATLQSAPDQHCSLIERVIALSIQVDEDGFATIEFSVDDVRVRLRRKGCGQAIRSLRLMVLVALVAGGRRCNDHGKRSRASAVWLRATPGNFTKTLQTK